MSVQTYVRVEINFFFGFSEGGGGGGGVGVGKICRLESEKGNSSSDIQDKLPFPNIFDVLVSS